MDARTRRLLPALPVLVRAVDQRRNTARSLLAPAARTEPGQRLHRRRRHPDPCWASARPQDHLGRDPATGQRRDLSREEDHAFWAWAIVEVLRATGVRVEELLELSHHSLVQYRLPTTGEIVPLLQILPSKTDTERLLVISPELAEVLSSDHPPDPRRRRSGPAGLGLRRPRTPLVTAGAAAVPTPDRHREPADRREQRRRVARRRPLPHRADRPGRRRAAALHPTRLPQDVHHRRHPRRPAPAHRPGHRRAPRHQRHPRLQGHLPGRGHPSPPRVPRPPPLAAPHRGIPGPTDEEWQEFLGHFERRKVSIGTCARAFGTPCIHEHAPLTELVSGFRQVIGRASEGAASFAA